MQHTCLKFRIQHILVPPWIVADGYTCNLVKLMEDFLPNGMMHERRYLPRPSRRCLSWSVCSAVDVPEASKSELSVSPAICFFHHEWLDFSKCLLTRVASLCWRMCLRLSPFVAFMLNWQVAYTTSVDSANFLLTLWYFHTTLMISFGVCYYSVHVRVRDGNPWLRGCCPLWYLLECSNLGLSYPYYVRPSTICIFSIVPCKVEPF